MDIKEMENEIKLQVADVIINLNFIESKLGDIISKYINSDKTHFIREVLLNSQIINISTKNNILKYILKTEEVEVPEDFFKAIKIAMTIRNIIAHSDSLLKLEDIVDIDFDWSNDGSFMYPIYGLTEPILTSINDGKMNYENIYKISGDFSKYFEIAINGLKEIDKKLFEN